MNTIEVKKWLLDRRLRQKEIAELAEASSASVCMTIRGARRDKRVIKVLQDKGCPPEYLGEALQ